MTHAVFFVSDSTAMTAKGLGKSLLSQFEGPFKEHLRPYINTAERIINLLEEIHRNHQSEQKIPIVFASIVDERLMQKLSDSFPQVIDIFGPFMARLELLLNSKSSKEVGQAHRLGNESVYQKRVVAIEYTLATDDGLKINFYDGADIILLGVSRCGKTPTALYLALNFGLKVANYPFTADDLPKFSLLDAHKKNREKLIGLSISTERLASIRHERRANTSYAAPSTIQAELDALGLLYEEECIPFIDTTTRSVEEIAASIVSLSAKKY